MDARHLAGDFLEDLASPLFACGNAVLLGDGARAARAPGVDDAQVGGLRFAKAEEHRLGFFGVACLVWDIVSTRIVQIEESNSGINQEHTILDGVIMGCAGQIRRRNVL